MKIIMSLAATLILIGCSVPRSVPEGGRIVGQQIIPTGKVLILTVADGQEMGQPVANGSGRGMVSSLRKVLSRHEIPLSITDAASTTQGFEEAAKINFEYLLKCTTTLWEDNATAWSGNGDKLKISIEMFEVKNHQLIAAASHYRVATGATFVGGSPDRFMDECAEGALDKIYGWAK